MKFSASILMRGETTEKTSPVWELVVFCIDADDDGDARDNALELGEAYATEYVTANGDRLRWKPEAVLEIQLMEPFPPVHGSELFSCFLREKEARGLMEPIDE